MPLFSVTRPGRSRPAIAFVMALVAVASAVFCAAPLAAAADAAASVDKSALEDGSASDTTSAQQQPAGAIGQAVPDFLLSDFRGKEHRLSQYSDLGPVAIVFLGTECPLAKLYGPRLQAIADDFRARGVTVLGVFSNRQDSVTEMDFYSRKHGVDFPLLKDVGNEVADQFGAERTPEAFLIDGSRIVRYHGRIDDHYGVGYGRAGAEREDLRIAIEELLAGKQVSVPAVEAVGCIIGRVREANEASDVTYSHQVSRLLQKRCVECHREGEIAPFALTEYDEVAGWGEMIAEVIREQRMPPWPANPEHGSFANERLMTSAEKELIYEWVKNGAPEGDPAELPPPRKFVEGWRLPREPDMVVEMRSKPFVVPAEGVIEYQYFAVDPGFKEDKWVCATDIVPGARSVVHHTIVFVSPDESDERRGLGWLGAYVPGQSSMHLPPGHARLIPAGSKLVFQQHYTPNGSEERDITKIGLVFADPSEVTHEVITQYAENHDFEIPPNASNHRVDASIDYWPAGAKILGASPHMHLRGKSFRFTARYPDGRREVLLDVPRYDFNWQTAYEFSQPIKTTSGFAIECTAYFDNSEDNPANPDPSQAVRWGDQSWEEMMLGFMEVAVPRGALKPQKRSSEPTAEMQQEADRLTAQLFSRFDANNDGKLTKKELPDTFGLFAFRRYDSSGDRILTPEEIREAALRDLQD